MFVKAEFFYFISPSLTSKACNSMTFFNFKLDEGLYERLMKRAAPTTPTSGGKGKIMKQKLTKCFFKFTITILFPQVA